MKKNQESHNDKVKEEPSNHYKLKTEAVDQLTNVLEKQKKEKENPSLIDETPIKPVRNPYKNDKLAKIPVWIKACFIKFWVGGVICYFFFWGLGIYVGNILDLIVLTGIAMGIINDVLVNSAFLYFESDQKEYHKYMLIPVSCKKIWTLFANIPLGLLEMSGVFYLYSTINILIVESKNLPEGTISLPVEPLLFGVFVLIIDLILLLFKNIFVKIIKDAIKKAKSEISR